MHSSVAKADGLLQITLPPYASYCLLPREPTAGIHPLAGRALAASRRRWAPTSGEPRRRLAGIALQAPKESPSKSRTPRSSRHRARLRPPRPRRRWTPPATDRLCRCCQSSPRAGAHPQDLSARLAVPSGAGSAVVFLDSAASGGARRHAGSGGGGPRGGTRRRAAEGRHAAARRGEGSSAVARRAEWRRQLRPVRGAAARSTRQHGAEMQRQQCGGPQGGAAPRARPAPPPPSMPNPSSSSQ
ncbi:hypothetical protein BRADI_2g41953v3 [Brachypodium distachyon]|uniref:Uncharacterized protein n=1 Tax=Brachypodium distachyon TaxID=15368 RepID=A0A2K2DDA4_BRADI|nr:hypothetical protein BRADI_2g41953v3 [Brachypodium distachyon]